MAGILIYKFSLDVSLDISKRYGWRIYLFMFVIVLHLFCFVLFKAAFHCFKELLLNATMKK